jgi:membrane-bound metal-dependent hydrolase YbcI (DUF457 family)
MDTITHGIAGALIGKAFSKGDDMFPAKPMNRARIITWSLMLGAIFPDIDVLRDIFSHDRLLVITWHRSITHSLLMLPIFSLLLAALTRSIARRFKWDAPSFAILTLIYAVGILSHILLDLVTTFGTMIWSPLKWSRPAWDLIFIVDFTFTGILLIPQFLAWIHCDAKLARLRSLLLWLVFVLLTFSVAALARIVGAPISLSAVGVIIMILSLVILLPAMRGWGTRIRVATWNRAGFFAACCYLVLAVVAHRRAFERTQKFAAFQGVQVESIGALPLPPSLLNWDGLIRTPRGVYELRTDLSQPSGIPDGADPAGSDSAGAAQASFTYKYFPDAPMNNFIQHTRELTEVQKVLWFDRFPVTRFHKEGSDAVVEILELRFPPMRPDRPASFTYRVRFDADGKVISQGWETK